MPGIYIVVALGSSLCYNTPPAEKVWWNGWCLDFGYSMAMWRTYVLTIAFAFNTIVLCR